MPNSIFRRCRCSAGGFLKKNNKGVALLKNLITFANKFIVI